MHSAIAGSDVEARSWPFAGIVFEPGREGATLQVFVGDTLERHVTHTLSRPVGIWLERTEDGSERGLRVEADEGALRLRFDVAQPSEQP